jgi:hypothetical protein
MLKSERLLLREFVETDFDAVHTYATDLEVVRYMPWGPNTESDTTDFLGRSAAAAAADPRVEYGLAVVRVEDDTLLGGIIRRATSLAASMAEWSGAPVMDPLRSRTRARLRGTAAFLLTAEPVTWRSMRTGSGPAAKGGAPWSSVAWIFMGSSECEGRQEGLYESATP